VSLPSGSPTQIAELHGMLVASAGGARDMSLLEFAVLGCCQPSGEAELSNGHRKGCAHGLPGLQEPSVYRWEQTRCSRFYAAIAPDKEGANPPCIQHEQTALWLGIVDGNRTRKSLVGYRSA